MRFTDIDVTVRQLAIIYKIYMRIHIYKTHFELLGKNLGLVYHIITFSSTPAALGTLDVVFSCSV